MSDVLERLQGYNPPDRTVDVDRQIAQDIADAASEITALRARVAELAATDWRLKWPACGLWKEMT